MGRRRRGRKCLVARVDGVAVASTAWRSWPQPTRPRARARGGAEEARVAPRDAPSAPGSASAPVGAHAFISGAGKFVFMM